jgi:hypothetical protein
LVGFFLWIAHIYRFTKGLVADENSDGIFIASRIVLSIDILIWFLRSLQYCLILKSVGPKLAVLNESVNF